jgi:hypothetical protein
MIPKSGYQFSEKITRADASRRRRLSENRRRPPPEFVDLGHRLESTPYDSEDNITATTRC